MTASAWKASKPPLHHVVGHHAAAGAVLDHEVGDEPLHVHGDLVLVGLLHAGVQQVVPGLVGAVAGAGEAGPAEGPLSDAPVLEAAEGAAPVVHLVDDVGGVTAEHGGGVLVGQVVGSFDRVEGVLLRGVVVAFGVVGQGGVDASLRGPRMAARRVDLREDGDVDALALRLDGRPQTGETATDDDELVVDHRAGSSSA